MRNSASDCLGAKCHQLGFAFEAISALSVGRTTLILIVFLLVSFAGQRASAATGKASTPAGPLATKNPSPNVKDSSYTFPITPVGQTSSVCRAFCFCQDVSNCTCDASGTQAIEHTPSPPFRASGFLIQPYANGAFDCSHGTPAQPPVTLNAGQQIAFTVSFSPASVGDFTDFLTISGYTLNLSGSTPRGSSNLIPYTPEGWSAPVVVSDTPGTQVDSSTLTSTEPLYVSWAVRNVGDLATAGGFYTDLLLDGHFLNRWQYFDALPPGWSIYLNDYKIGPLGSGAHTLELIPDSTHSTLGSSADYTKNFNITESAPTHSIQYRPGPTDGIDMFYRNDGSGHFSDNTLLTVGGDNDESWSLLKFDLGCLPHQAISATLTFTPHAHSGSSTNLTMDLYRMDSSWKETGWSVTPDKTLWRPSLPSPVVGSPYSIDVTDLYNGWKSGAFPNYGLALVPTRTDNSFNDFFSSDAARVALRPTLSVAYGDTPGEPFKPCFPLEGTTPYKAQINTLLDHSNTKGEFYTRDDSVVAYDGTKASKKCGKVYGYGNSQTILGYTRCEGGPGMALLNYVQGTPSPAGAANVFWYDGHSGYDYQAQAGMPILAATDGILCVSTHLQTKGSGMWSAPNICPYGDDVNVNRGLSGTSSTSWDRWHMFYILHPSGRSTWYLHSDHLDAAIVSAIRDHGYAEVTRLQQVALVGNWSGLDPSTGKPWLRGSAGYLGPHLHFEVRDGINTKNVLDPYGDGGILGIMWGAAPDP